MDLPLPFERPGPPAGSGAIAVEQFGCGPGFTAYMRYQMLLAEGENKTAHYALCRASWRWA